MAGTALPAPGTTEEGGFKYYVRCGMRGASGVVHEEQVRPGSPEYEFGRRMLMADLRALLEGLMRGGAQEVVIYDDHAGGRNVDVTELPPFASLVSGRPALGKGGPGDPDSSCAGLILLAVQAAAGTPGAVLPCTWDPSVEALQLNGRSVGAIEMAALLAADQGVPFQMITGDGAAVAEGCGVAPEALGVVVKDSLDRQAAVCYPLSVTTDLIRRAAEQLVRQPPAAQPARVEGPVTLDVTLAAGPLLDRLRALYPRHLGTGRVMRLKARSVSEAWAAFHAAWLRGCSEPAKPASPR